MGHAGRLLSPTTLEALQLLGGLIEEGRLRKGWSRDMLAERVGVGAITIRRLIRGEPSVAIGTYFEAATLVGVPLFEQDSPLGVEQALSRQRTLLKLLPKRVRGAGDEPLDDDF
jgi:transcriptional regulator with XRE-family HTH domain